MKLILESCGKALPKGKIDNHFFESYLDTSDEWIVQRSGISERFRADHRDPEEQLTELAKKAAIDCLSRVPEAQKAKIGLVLAASFSVAEATPALSTEVCGALELSPDVIAMDLNAACTGYVYALEMARHWLSAQPEGKLALILGAERVSDYVDYQDRSTCILFGDGAAATLWSSGEGESESFRGGTLPDAEVIRAKRGGHIHMDGRKVYRFALETLPPLLNELKAEVQAEGGIDYYLLHQANLRMIEAIRAELNEGEEKFPTNLQYYGNSSAASLPLLLTDLWQSGKLDRDSWVKGNFILAGFGAGLSYGAILMKGRQ